MPTTLDTITERIRSNQLEEAKRDIEQAERSRENPAEVGFLKGYLLERSFAIDSAIVEYEKALEVSPEHAPSAFHAGLLRDLIGDEEEAVQRYERCVTGERVRVNALVNLALLYEDCGQYGQAEACLKNILAEFPNHVRARQFLKSIQSSFDMMFDEDSQRERDQRNAVLDMPMSDFELSVRSRNCLRQMNIRTLGDLLGTTEAELLSYKNFGETSLNEIKTVLGQKGLRLGQGLQPVEIPAAPPPPPERPVPDSAAALSKPVTDLELSVRSRKCLQRLGVTTLGELITHSEAELLATKNFGQTSLTEIRRQLGQMGLSLRPSI